MTRGVIDNSTSRVIYDLLDHKILMTCGVILVLGRILKERILKMYT